jgi:hypothetical protein
VGQNNIWLPVKAPDGIQGYVAAWLVSKTKTMAIPAAPATGSAPVAMAVPNDAPVVKTNVDALKLRSKPDSTDATILKIYPIGTELKCLEPAADVKRKVGNMYEWLKVSDVEGKQGVVAAWYVALVSVGSFGPQAQRQSATAPGSGVGNTQPLIVRAVEDDLALRSTPFISNSTLIYRVPRGTELIAIEPANVAAPKIGKTDQWLHVHDVKGNEGYVAAWLVEERPGAPLPQVSPKDC